MHRLSYQCFIHRHLWTMVFATLFHMKNKEMLSLKKFILLLSLAMMLTLVTPVWAAEEDQMLSVIFEDDFIDFADHEPIIEKGVTMVPVRPLFNALALEVGWDGNTRTVTGSSEHFTVVIEIGNDKAIINDEEIKLPVTPRIINGATYVPLRFISEQFGLSVGWLADAYTVIISSFGGYGFLWKTEHGNNTVYLLGSIHIGDEEMYPLHSTAQVAFFTSDYLVVEVDITAISEEEHVQLMQELGMYQDGTTIQDHLSAETYNKLEEVLAEHDLTVEVVEQFKPWVVMSTIQTLAYANAGYYSEYGIDINLIMLALEFDLPIIQLETLESQFNIFADLTPEMQEQALLETLAEYEQADVIVEELVAMWKNGDQEGLLAITEETEGDEQFNEMFLHDRNHNMFEQIEAFLNDEEGATYLVVVGAAHMLGESGLVTLLQNNGYEVERQ